MNTTDIVTTVVLVVVCYLIGSIPTAYLAARWLRGFDIRKSGSGTVGGANVWHSVSRKVGLAVIVVDLCKGVVGVLIARLIGAGPEGQVAACVAAIVGHNWSVFLRFGGGRGIATLGGALLVLAPREVLAVAAIGAVIVVVTRSMPFCVLCAVALLPAVAWIFGQPVVVVVGCVLILFVVVLKRVLPRRRKEKGDWKHVFLYRLVFDRDVRSRDAWINRGTDELSGSGSRGKTRKKRQKDRSD